jgi:hypothetical protein
MSNPARDYFSSLFGGPLEKLADQPDQHPIDLANVQVEAKTGNSVSIDGTVYTGVSNDSNIFNVSIVLKPSNEPLQPQVNRTLFIVYDYSLSPNVIAQCSSIPGTAARYPLDLRSREKPWPWIRGVDWAVGYQEIIFGGAVSLSKFNLKWDLYVPDFASPLSGSEFQLRNFRLYSVRSFGVSVDVSGPGLTPPSRLNLVAAPVQQVTLAPWPNGNTAPYATALRFTTDDGVEVQFDGTVNAAPSTDTTWTSSVVIPAAIGGIKPPDGTAVVHLISYLALLDAYKKDLTKVLSLQEAVVLDFERLVVPPNSNPDPIVKRDHRFMSNPNAAIRPASVPLLGGMAAIDNDRHFKLAQVLGQSAASLALTKQSFANVIAPMRRFGLSAIHVSYYWQNNFVIASAGTNLFSGSGEVTKNSSQLDAVASLQVAKEFIDDHPALDAVVASGGRFIVQSPELGDTWKAMSFQLTGTEACLARTQISGIKLQMLKPRRNITKFEFVADQQYQAGFRFSLLASLDELLERDKAAAGMLPSSPAVTTFIANLGENQRFFAGLINDTPNAELRDIDLADNSQLHATNGFYDLLPVPVGAYSPKDYSKRRPMPTAPAQERVLWYHAMRYWNQANIAYLCLSVNPLARMLGTIPFSHMTNLNTPRGYWSGYEHYHVTRSGVLDIIWFYDGATRGSTIAYGTLSHIFIVNVVADFARACALLRSPEDRYRPEPREIGAYLTADRTDMKAIVWASRGATHFETFAAASQYLVPDGLYDTGDASLQVMAQSQQAAKKLLAAQDALRGARRPQAAIAIIVPMSDGAWDAGDAGAGKVLDFSTMGLHALFTQHHLAVDFLFEEQITDQPNVLNQYQVVVSTLKLMRDDVFLLIANWVETIGGVFVCAAGFHYYDVISNPADKLTVGACFNEYYELRQNRLDWLLGTNGAGINPPSVHTVTAQGLGFVVVPNEAPTNFLNFPREAQIGYRYLFRQRTKPSFFIEPDTISGDKVSEELFDQINACVEKTQGVGFSLKRQRHCWVENKISGALEPFVEAVFLKGSGSSPTLATIVLIDYKQRPFAATGDERFTPIGEAQREKTILRVIVNPDFLTLTTATDTDGRISLTTFVNGFEISLQDYAIVELR